MNSYIPLFVLFFILFILYINKKKKNRIIAYLSVKRKHKSEMINMQSLIKDFIGEECLIYTINDGTIQGTVKDVTDSAVSVLRKDFSREIINLEFIVRVRELPKNKKGKNKMVLD